MNGAHCTAFLQPIQQAVVRQPTLLSWFRLAASVGEKAGQKGHSFGGRFLPKSAGTRTAVRSEIPVSREKRSCDRLLEPRPDRGDGIPQPDTSGSVAHGEPPV